MITYRLATLNDFEEVLEIENECFVNPYSREELEYEFSKNPVNKIVVATSDNKVIGFIDFLITFNSSTIMQVAVKDKFRHQGIATQLLHKMEDLFPKEIEDKVEMIALEVRESNEAAKNLYQKEGYQIVTIKKHYYKDGENAIYMLKRL